MGQTNLFSALDDKAEKSLISYLLDQSRLYRWSKDYKELLDFVTRLHNFALFNAFLLNVQKPGLRFADLICKRNGLHSHLEACLSHYVKANTSTGNLDFYLILKAAGQIKTLLQLGDMVSLGPRN